MELLPAANSEGAAVESKWQLGPERLVAVCEAGTEARLVCKEHSASEGARRSRLSASLLQLIFILPIFHRIATRFRLETALQKAGKPTTFNPSRVVGSSQEKDAGYVQKSLDLPVPMPERPKTLTERKV